MKFSGQQHLVKRKVGGDKLWRDLQVKRKTRGEFDEIVKHLRKEAPQVLRGKPAGSWYAVKGQKTSKGGVTAHKREQRPRPGLAGVGARSKGGQARSNRRRAAKSN